MVGTCFVFFSLATSLQDRRVRVRNIKSNVIKQVSFKQCSQDTGNISCAETGPVQ